MDRRVYKLGCRHSPQATTLALTLTPVLLNELVVQLTHGLILHDHRAYTLPVLAMIVLSASRYSSVDCSYVSPE